MLRSETRILTTHTGSLPRPAALTALYVRRARGEAVAAGEIEAAGRAALADIVPKQIAAGIDIGNNGEQQREAFFLYVRHRMSGFGGGWVRPGFADMRAYPGWASLAAAMAGARENIANTGTVPQAIGEVTYLDRALIEEECADFRAVLDAQPRGFAEPFLSAPSPGIIASALQNVHYDSDAAYLAALGAALSVEYHAIVDAGFLLQIDAPDLALERHVLFQDRPLRDFLDFAEAVVATINTALHGIPTNRVRMHACWGNYEGPHDRDVDLADILPVLRQAKVGALVLPFANPRHQHETRVLRALAGGDQLVVAGVIDTLTNFVEHPEVVADRIEAAARALGDPARVIAGTDCGFDTSAGRGRVAEDVVWAKLTSLSAGARLASARLFARN
ncbi:MAG: epoxyalkane--coenzyme M transferase [Rhodospirillales bacterium]|nr:epoxyalkane--coenzyme M transferase [Rhodospirillales bacterium]